ncbi:uncharacterized protein [Anabrus simplex]|uniref:uncharacterized protein n=1 Tax=Anabrus simplex TaxID=316456 RepID=UPI0035A30D5B
MSCGMEPVHHDEVSSKPVGLEESLRKLSLKDENNDIFSELPVDDVELLESIKKLDCPFTWFSSETFPLDSPDVTINRCEEKAEEIMEDELDWRVFILNMVLCHEYTRKNLIGDAFAKHRLLDNYIKKSEEVDKNNTNDVHVSISALKQLVLSCRCFLECKSKLIGDAKATLMKIKTIDLDEKDQGTIWGTRGAVYMEYGYYGTKAAVDFIENALQLNADQAEWHFLLGKCLGRIRRIDNFNAPPENRELTALEKAIDYSERVPYMIFLAQAYRESSFKLFSSHRNDMDRYQAICDKMNNRSVELYRKALARGEMSAHVNIRCGLGLLKLPSPHRDVELAKTCILKALSLAPNNAMAHHAAGYYYERDGKLDKAKFHYRQAADNRAFGAFMDLLKICEREDSEYNPMSEFENMLVIYKEKPRQEEILCQMGSYCYFIKNNFKEALKYWKEVVDDDPGSVRLEVHKCAFLKMKTPVNLHNVIFDEARMFLKLNSGSPEDRKSMRQLIVKYIEKRPDLIENPPISYRDKVMKEIEESESKQFRFRGRGRGRGRSRRGQGGRYRGQSSQRGRPTKDGFQMKQEFFQNFSRGRDKSNFTPRGSRESSVEGHRQMRGNSFRGVRSRDTSVDSRRSRDSSLSDRSDKCKSSSARNWRGERVPNNRSAEDCSRLGEGKGANAYQRRSRTYSQSSVESGSSATREWKLGCSGGDQSSNWRERGKDTSQRNGSNEGIFRGYPRQRGKRGFAWNEKNGGRDSCEENGFKQYDADFRKHDSRDSSVDIRPNQRRCSRESSLSDHNDDSGSRNWRRRPENNLNNVDSEHSSRIGSAPLNRCRSYSHSSVESGSSVTRDWRLGCSGGAQGEFEKQKEQTSTEFPNVRGKEFSRSDSRDTKQYIPSMDFSSRNSQRSRGIKYSYDSSGESTERQNSPCTDGGVRGSWKRGYQNRTRSRTRY